MPRIVVVGSANVDLTIVTDEFPRAGETILGREFHLGFGGKGANQAVAARLCGAQVSMVARVGADLFGPATVENFGAFGIDVRHVLTTPGFATGVAPIFVSRSGENRILVVKGANERLLPADVDAAAALMESGDVVVLQLEIPRETVYHVLTLAHDRGAKTILNPAPAQELDFEQIRTVDYFIPNETEAERLSGLPVSSVDEAQACARSFVERGLRAVIVTLGAKGAMLSSREITRHIPSFAVEPLDTTGAGDAFIGSFAYWIATGMKEAEAVRRANLYAALSTLQRGTQKSFVSRERFEEEWRQRRG